MNGIYFDRKKARKRRLIFKLTIYGGLTFFFALLIGAAYLIIYSPIFQIKEINIGTSDVQKLTEDLKFYFATRSKIASILGGNNILVWRDEEINEFLKSRPQIAELTIKKDYLERKIQIEVKEREKFGIWCPSSLADNEANKFASSSSQLIFAKDGGCMWFDKEGTIFAEAPLMEGELINKVFDFSGRQLNPRDKILEENQFDNLLKIFEVLDKSGLKIKNLYLKDIALQEVSVESPSIPKIYFSLRINPEFALAGIKSLKKIGLEKIDYIDFRVENRAYYKMK